jgi:hypothetical protein
VARIDRLLPLAANVALKGLAVGLSVYPLTRPQHSHFRGKAMAVRAVAYPPAVALVPLAWLAAGRPRPYPHGADMAVAGPFVVDAGGNVLGLFGSVPHYDLFAHYINWAMIVATFGRAVGPMTRSRPTTLGLAIGFGATTHILWEIGEYVMMKSGASGLDLTYENTIHDFIFSFLGTLTGSIATATLLWPGEEGGRAPFGWRKET